MSYFNLNQTYHLKTEKSKEYIIGILSSIIELEKSKTGFATYFKYPDYSSILLSENKIIINNVISSSLKKNIIGEIHVSLTTTTEGTLIIANLRPYPPPITLILAGLAGLIGLLFLLYCEQIIKLSQNEFMVVILFFLGYSSLIFFINPKMVKNSMKSYLDNVFFPLKLGSKFILINNTIK